MGLCLWVLLISVLSANGEACHNFKQIFRFFGSACGLLSIRVLFLFSFFLIFCNLIWLVMVDALACWMKFSMLFEGYFQGSACHFLTHNLVQVCRQVSLCGWAILCRNALVMYISFHDATSYVTRMNARTNFN